MNDELIDSIIDIFRSRLEKYPMGRSDSLFQIKINKDLKKTYVYDIEQLPKDYLCKLDSIFIPCLHLYEFTTSELIEFKLKLL